MGGFDFLRVILAELAGGGDVEAEVARCEGCEVFVREAEEAGGGAESRAVLGVRGVFVLFAEVDECACELDESFEKGVVFAGCAEPEVFEHVVGFVVVAGVEAGEPAGVARVGAFAAGAVFERGHEGLDAVAFFHRGKGATHYPAQPCARQADALLQHFPSR